VEIDPETSALLDYRRGIENFSRTGGRETDAPLEAFRDEFMLHTFLGQAVQRARFAWEMRGDGADFTPVEGYNAIRDEDLTGYEDYYGDFASARSPSQTQLLRRMIDTNRGRRLNLENSDNWFYKLAADVIDPVNLIPVPFARGINFVNRAARRGAAGVAAFAPFETARASLDPTATAEEVAFSIGGSAIVAGLLGGAFGNISRARIDGMGDNLFRWGEAVEARGRIGRDQADTIHGRAEGDATQWVGRMAGETDEAYRARIDEINNNPEVRADYEAVAGMHDPDAIMPTGIGAEKFKFMQHPYLYLKNNSFVGPLGNDIRRMADEITGTIGLFNKGDEFMEGSAQGAFIEAKKYNPIAVEAHQGMFMAFQKSLGINPAVYAGRPMARTLRSMADSFTKNDQRTIFNDDMMKMYMLGKEAILSRTDEAYLSAVREGATAFGTYMEKMGREATLAELFGIRQLRNQVRRLDKLYEERGAEIVELRRGMTPENATRTMGEIRGKERARETLLEQMSEIAEDINRLREMNARGEIPRVGDAVMGHFPRFWKIGKIRTDRDELARRLEEHFIRVGNVGERVQESIDRIVREGNFPQMKRSIAKALQRANRSPDEIAAMEREFDAALASARDIEGRISALDPLLRRYMVQENVIFWEGGQAAVDALRNVRTVLAEIERAASYGMDTNFGVATSALSRRLDIPSHLVMDFIETDPDRILRMYHRRMAPSIAMAKKFDDPSMIDQLEALAERMDAQIAAAPANAQERLRLEKDNVIESIETLRDKVLGVYKIPEDPSALSNRAIQFSKNWMVLALMGQATVAGLADIGRVAMSLGVQRSFRGALERFTSGIDDFKLASHEVAMAGQAAEVALHGRWQSLFDTETYYAGSTWIEEFARDGVDRMFIANALAPYTDMMKRWSGSMIQSEMIRLSQKVARGEALTRTEKMWMSRSGISEDLARAIHGQWEAAGSHQGNSLFLANTEAWADDAIRDKFRTALATEIDNAVITPGPGEKLNFMSTPVGSLLTQFKTFSLAAVQRTTLAGLQARDARSLGGLLSMVAMGYVVDYWKSPDYDRREMTSLDRLIQAIDYSGALGVLTDLNNTLEVATGHEVGLRPLMGIDPLWKEPNIAQRIGQVGGPTVSLLGDLVWSLTSSDSEGSDKARSVRRLIPFNNLFWLDGLADKIHKGAAEMLEN
jgi:hypothetical protein